MTYTLIGGGNMAWFISRNLYAQGHACMGVYGRNEEAASQLAKSVYADVATLENLPESDCCIIAVADQAIGELSGKLRLKETVVIHTAGSVALDVLQQTNRAVLWAVYSINKSHLPAHRNIPVIYEYSTTKAKDIVTRLAYALSDIAQEVNGEQRQWLHLCAVIGNNFTNHLMTLCEKICAEKSLPFSLLRPILQQTFDSVSSIEPSQQQTGPAIRNDRRTMEQHVTLLKEHPHLQEVYQSLSASIEDMYRQGDK